MMLEIDFTYSAMSLKMHMGHCVMTEGNKRKDGLKNILTQIPFLGNVKKKECSKSKLPLKLSQMYISISMLPKADNNT